MKILYELGEDDMKEDQADIDGEWDKHLQLAATIVCHLFEISRASKPDLSLIFIHAFIIVCASFYT